MLHAGIRNTRAQQLQMLEMVQRRQSAQVEIIDVLPVIQQHGSHDKGSLRDFGSVVDISFLVGGPKNDNPSAFQHHLGHAPL